MGIETNRAERSDDEPAVLFAAELIRRSASTWKRAHGSLLSVVRLYGASGHDITFSNAGLPGVILHYTAFKDIIADVDNARVYGGIHFRFDQEAGTRQGQRVGEYVYKHNLRASHPR